MLDLTDAEKSEIKRSIDAGIPLPAKHHLRLFADAPETELVWKGKSADVETAVLPFQSIEQIDEPRAKAGEYQSLFPVGEQTGRQAGGWTNKLIWGDNKLVLSSLKSEPWIPCLDLYLRVSPLDSSLSRLQLQIQNKTESIDRDKG